MSKKSLFSPITLNDTMTLHNRIVMAPMTRSRADEKKVPSAMAIEYYRQRSSAGLIITEATSPSPKLADRLLLMTKRTFVFKTNIN